MERKAANFFAKHDIQSSDLLYMLRDDRKTVLYLLDGRKIPTYIPMKYLLEAMPRGAFLNITKGVVISAAEIESIDSGVYTMSDGRQFVGRRRGAGEHKFNRHRLENKASYSHRLLAESIAERFSVLDNHLLGCCVMELVFDASGHGVDFVFRYCNAAMIRQEKINMEDILDHSLFEVFADADPRWLAVYSDVALNGTQRVIETLHLKNKRPVTVFCYQPMEGYCACAMVWDKTSESL